MRSTTVIPDITRLSRFGFVNAYLVREDDGLTLVDTMTGGSAKGILAAAQALGAPIVRILLTHAHADHVGSLDALADALGGVEVLASEREARLLAGDRSLDPGEPQDQDRRQLDRRRHRESTRTPRARRPRRLARGRRRARAHAGAHRAARHPRPTR